MKSLRFLCAIFVLMLMTSYVGALSAEDDAAKVLAEYTFKTDADLKKSGAAIEKQGDESFVVFSGSEDKQSALFYWIDKKKFKGKFLKFTVEAKGEDLSKTFLFGLQGKIDGKDAWPVDAGEKGSFDWKTISFTTDFSKLNMETLILRAGLQNSKGKLYVKRIVIEDITPSTSVEK